MKWISVFVAGICLFTQSAFAGPYLIVAGKGGKFDVDLAKSYKAAGPGKVEFVLDTTKKIDKTSTAVNFMAVKSSLEKQLGAKWSAKVSGSEASTLVEYKGKEADFLKAVSQAKIKATATEELAMEGSSSDAGTRAKDSPPREPKEDEVRGTVLKIDANMMVMVVDAKGTGAVASKVANGKVKVTPVQPGFAVKSRIYFVPEVIEASGVKIKSATAN
jgi:hypothetical protein